MVLAKDRGYEMPTWLIWIMTPIAALVIIQVTGKSMSLDIYPGKYVPIIEYHYGDQAAREP